MKKVIKYFSVVLLIILSLLTITACKEQEVKYDLSIETVYAVAQEAGFEGTWQDLVEAFKGEQGVGIKTIRVNAENQLEVTLTNNNVITTNKIITESAISVKNVYISKDNELIIQLTDNRTINAGAIPTINGKDGTKIEKVVSVNSDETGETYAIQCNDGSNYVFKVKNGLSAYELYKKNFPDYVGDEKQWLEDLTNGRLGLLENGKSDVTVYFDADNGSAITEQTVKYGDKLERPENPQKGNFEFDGWYTDDGEKWSFNGYTATKTMTLTARYVDKSIQEISENKSELKKVYEELVESGEFEGTFFEFVEQYYKNNNESNNTTPQTDLTESINKAILSAVIVQSQFTKDNDSYYSSGSGVIYKLDKKTGDAYIITNYHVVYDNSSNTENHISNNIIGKDQFVSWDVIPCCSMAPTSLFSSASF